MQHKQHGFTLIELIITVAIIGILVAVAFPSYVEHIAKGKRNECRSGLLQTMQQQERYYTQRNTYASYASTASSAPARTFSGDRSESSACSISAQACTAPGVTDINQCIESRATLTNDPANIDYLYFDSDGRKGCSVSGTRVANNKLCWQ